MAFLTICLNPTLQKTLCFPQVKCGEVNRTYEHRFDASGKGINVTRVLVQLGQKAVHLTQLGGEMRPLFLALCQQDGLSVEWAESNSPIRFCYTVINKNDASVTELVEESSPVGKGTEERLLEKFDILMNQNFSTLIISGTKAQGFSDNIIPAFVRKAKEKGLRLILDIKGKDLIDSLQYKPDVIKPNISEFADTFKTKECKTVMQDIYNKYGSRIILTCGSQKLYAFDGSYFEMDVLPVKAVNTTGCGDAFTAGLASFLAGGAEFRDAISEGIKCGALNAGLLKPGVIC